MCSSDLGRSRMGHPRPAGHSSQAQPVGADRCQLVPARVQQHSLEIASEVNSDAATRVLPT